MRPIDGGGYVLAVADGIGGGPGGQEASRLALQSFDDAVGVDVRDSTRLVSAVSLANRRVFDLGQHQADLAGLGTTLTAAVILPHRLLLAHVGDSRAYQIQGGRLERLTVDHSVAGEMERAGTLTSDEAEHHPRKHVLTRAVGPYEKVSVDVIDMEWPDDAWLLLCTDGLTSVLSDADIFDICQIASGSDLINRLIAKALERGGPDNITVVVAHDVIEEGDPNGR